MQLFACRDSAGGVKMRKKTGETAGRILTALLLVLFIWAGIRGMAACI